MKYLLQAISARRGDVQLPDPDLRQLLMDVRKGRDEKEEFFEAIERIITELRNYTEHSGPFLTRVSKREAPDYYDVIKNPMDLGTMLKKLRNNGYRNKKQFAHDLDLIWENCLVYNCDPAHPLRRSVHFMRKKANHLLEFVSDKSDVKDALSQWEANDHATSHQASSSFLNGTQSFGDDNRYSSPNLAGLTPFSRRPTGLNLSIGPSAASTEQKAKAKALKLAKIKRKKLKEKAKKKKKLRIIDSDDEEGGASKDKGKGKEKASDDEDDQMDLDDDDDDDDDDLDLDDDDDDDEDEDLQAEGEGEEGEVPFEQRPAIVKTQEAMQIFNNLDWGISKGEENQDQILYGSTETFNGNSKRLKKDSSYNLDQSLNLVKELGGNGRAGPLRAALIASTSTSTPLETSGNSSDDETQKQDSSKDPNPKPESSDVSMSETSKPNTDSQQQLPSNQTKEHSFFDLEQGGDSSDALSWWAAQSNDRLSGGALPNLKGSELIPTNLNGESGSAFQAYYTSSSKGKERERPAKRRMLTSSSSATISPLDFKNSQVTYSQPNGISSSSTSIPHPNSSSTSMPVATPDSALPKRLALARSRAGLRGMICENVRTIGKVKRTHKKFGKLSQISQMNPNELEEENNFASLLPSEEEETEDEDLNNYSGLDPEWSKSLPISVSNSKFSIAKDEDESKVEWRNPYSDLTTEAASDSVRGCVQTLLAHKGFDASHTSPLDVLAGAASEYMMNLGRTLRLYSDRYSHKMSAEEIILHTLHENSTADVAALESYIRDDVERHGSKMTDLLRKLRASYKERRKLHSEKAAAVEEAAFEDGADTFASGLFTSATGEDFFGFGSMGLADELGTSNLQIPSRLWYGKGKGSRPSGSGRYDGHDSNRIRSNSDPFPPPPPFVPLSAAGISAQIGLLKPFYLERARIQARRMLGKGETESGSASEVKPPPLQVQDPVQQGEASNGIVSDKESTSHQGPEKPVESNAEEEEMKLNIVLEDEEHIKQKILPSGKLPTKRAMWGVDEIGSFDDEENPPTVSAKTRGVGRGNGGRGRGRGKKKKLAENGS